MRSSKMRRYGRERGRKMGRQGATGKYSGPDIKTRVNSSFYIRIGTPSTPSIQEVGRPTSCGITSAFFQLSALFRCSNCCSNPSNELLAKIELNCSR